jgi:hypothetical protein
MDAFINLPMPRQVVIDQSIHKQIQKQVEDLHLVRDKGSGKSKGFAFVKYEDQRSTVLAVDNFNGIRVRRYVYVCACVSLSLWCRWGGNACVCKCACVYMYVSLAG